MASSALRLWRTCLSLALLAAVLPTSLAVRWSTCGPKKVPVTVLNVTMVPDPAVAGEDMTFVLPAESGMSLEGGWVYVSVFFHGVPVHLERDNLCVKTPCPVPPGVFIFKNAQGLPDVTPAGHYTLRLLATNLRRKILFCAKVEFEIVKAKGDLAGKDVDELLNLGGEGAASMSSEWEDGIPEDKPFSWTHPSFQKQ